jgi:Cd2+/Zn2+-exporting ATPase
MTINQEDSINLELHITGMDCADCALKLEKGVANLQGVELCQVNFTTAKMTVSGDIGTETVTARIRSLGYGVSDRTEPYQAKTTRQRITELLRQPRNTLTLIGAVFLVAGFAVQWVTSWPAVLFFLIGGLFGLYFPARSGWGAIRAGQGLDMNVLMTLAAVGAFAIGEYAEAATVIVLFSLGEALEGYTMERARDSIRSLTSLAPAEAITLRPCIDCAGHLGDPLPDGSGPYSGGPCPWCGEHETTLPVEELDVGDRILVKPGERIPMDGQVLTGRSAVNQAPITGESIPVEKSPGDELFAGSINGDGLLEIEVTHLAADNTLSRLIHLVEEAQSQKTPTQRFVDKFARVYTPAVVVTALLVATLPPLLLGQPFLDTPDVHGWLYRALTLLVIACPCALVIATPVAVVSAISAAARQGVLIKGGAYLEALGRVKVVAFDKTGTLTQGHPQLVGLACADTCCVEARQADPWVDCRHCDDMLSVAAALERYSTHPLARAVTDAAIARQLPQLAAAEVETLPGRGLRGRVAARHITVGSHAMLHSDQPETADLCRLVEGAEASGYTTVLVGENERLHGYMAISDPPRQHSRAALAALKQTGIQKTVMLTGDNATVAHAMGHSLGIDEIQAGLLPEDKVAAVRRLVELNGDTVAMVGDGVNDAPALAAASVGIAMGAGGTAQALETADVALMTDELTRLPQAIRLGQRAGAVIRFNIWFSLAIKALFLTAALFGVATLWMAVFADVGTSLLVTLNGMRLLRKPHV